MEFTNKQTTSHNFKGPKIYSCIEDIADGFKGILLDAYGVFWGGGSVGKLPGSDEAMKRLVESGKVVGVLSNSTQLGKKEIQKVESHGFIKGIHFHFYITSGDVTRSLFLDDKLHFPTPKKKFYLLCKGHLKLSPHQAIFSETLYEETLDITQADFIYVSVPHVEGKDSTDSELFRELVQDIFYANKAKIPMICANPDRFSLDGTPPRTVVCQGSLAAMYEELGGEVFYIGKPSISVFGVAKEHFFLHGISSPKEILMVGDTPETDIRGANHSGMHSALLIKTGMMTERVKKSSLDNLIQNLGADDVPSFFVNQLAKP